MELFHSKDFWFLLSFAIFIGILYRKAWPVIITGLDRYIEKVRAIYAMVSEAKEKSASELSVYEKKKAHLHSEIQALMDHARAEIEQKSADAVTRLDALSKRRERQFMEKVALLESQAMLDIRSVISDLILSAVREIFTKELSTSDHKRMVVASLQEVQKKLN